MYLPSVPQPADNCARETPDVMKLEEPEHPVSSAARRRGSPAFADIAMALLGGFAGLAAAAYVLFTEGLWPPFEGDGRNAPAAAVGPAPAAGPTPMQPRPGTAGETAAKPEPGLTPLGGGAGPVTRQQRPTPRP
jgi:hypothetical protein